MFREFYSPSGGGSSGEPSKILPHSIIRLTQVPVHYEYTWSQAIAHGGPHTTLANCDVCRVGNLYVAESKGLVLTNIALVNFAAYVEHAQVQVLATLLHLERPINPQECFAIGEHFPGLNRDPGFFDPMGVISLQECTYLEVQRVCSLWYNREKRECRLYSFEDGWYKSCWFGFVESKLMGV